MIRKVALAVVASIALTGPAAADVWDTAADSDNGPTTDNQITHGMSQVHDLGALIGPASDQDWYYMVQEPFSSYEVLCDGLTGDISSGSLSLLQRMDAATATALQDSADYASFAGHALSLRFANDSPSVVSNQQVRVSNAACGTVCDSQDQYHITAWETTIAVPRYNNFGGQVTVLIIQNPTEMPVSGNARLWTPAGGATPVTTVAFTLQGRQAAVINLATVNGGVANGTSGTLTITNNGRYGQLAVKSVALDPATGFSFDSPGLYKP